MERYNIQLLPIYPTAIWVEEKLKTLKFSQGKSVIKLSDSWYEVMLECPHKTLRSSSSSTSNPKPQKSYKIQIVWHGGSYHNRRIACLTNDRIFCSIFWWTETVNLDFIIKHFRFCHGSVFLIRGMRYHMGKLANQRTIYVRLSLGTQSIYMFTSEYSYDGRTDGRYTRDLCMDFML